MEEKITIEQQIRTNIDYDSLLLTHREDEKKSKGRLCPLGIRTSSAISCGNPFNLPNLFKFIL